jgi:nicotinate-nucleotide--dimethylbenzimidazole phosphoribosyltransferase
MSPREWTLLERTCAAITHPDARVAAEVQRALDGKTKPRGSLGRLEALACRYAAVRGLVRPPLPTKAVVVMGADHGVADEGVSAYPAAVTRQMLLNFAAGGAAINVLARQMGARVVVVDMGIREAIDDAPGIRALRVGAGTANFTRGPAMTEADARRALEAGMDVARGLAGEGVTLLGIGEMGIGNTTSASALTAALLGLPASEVVGRGTGVDAEGLRRKVDAVERGLAVNRPQPDDALDVLAKLGGFEIGGLAGVVLGAAEARVPIVVDGFIANAAALVAARLCPRVPKFLVAGHRSVEPGHARLLEALGLAPLLDLELRLGEGTGAVLAMGLVEAAVRVLLEMATFDEAGVSDTGR